MKKLCTFDKLMAKYKEKKADSENRPLKKKSLHLLSMKTRKLSI